MNGMRTDTAKIQDLRVLLRYETFFRSLRFLNIRRLQHGNERSDPAYSTLNLINASRRTCDIPFSSQVTSLCNTTHLFLDQSSVRVPLSSKVPCLAVSASQDAFLVSNISRLRPYAQAYDLGFIGVEVHIVHMCLDFLYSFVPRFFHPYNTKLRPDTTQIRRQLLMYLFLDQVHFLSRRFGSRHFCT